MARNVRSHLRQKIPGSRQELKKTIILRTEWVSDRESWFKFILKRKQCPGNDGKVRKVRKVREWRKKAREDTRKRPGMSLVTLRCIVSSISMSFLRYGFHAGIKCGITIVL